MFTKPSRAIAAWTRADFLACLACAALGLVLAVEPHLANWAAEGTLDYIQDGDDLLYLAISRVPYHGEWSLRDPFSTPEERVPTLYAWLQFVPLAKLAKLLGLSSVTTSLLWRAIGGPLLGAGVFVLFRKLLGGLRRPTAWALGCSVICLADRGFAEGRPLVQGLGLLLEMVRPSGPLTAGNRIPLYRVVTPILNLPWLLLLAAVLVPGGRRGRWAWAAGAICLGLCFHLYFFFWTAALVGVGIYLGGLALAWRLGRGEARAEGRSELKFAAAVLAGGMVLGAPQVYNNSRTFADPQYRPVLERMVRGQRLEPGNPRRTAHLWNRWPLAELAVGGAAIVGLGLWNLGLPWCLTLAGYLLSTSAAVTGLEFENFHWGYVYSAFGEVLILSVVATVLDGLGPSRWKRGLWALPVTFALIALAWRAYEPRNHRYAVEANRTLRELDPLRDALAGLPADESLAGPPVGNIAVLLTRAGLLYEYDQTCLSSPIPNAEVGRRFALDAWLMGMDMPRFLEAIEHSEPVTRFGMREAWIADFRAVLDGGADDLLRRYRVGALILPAGAPAPVRGGPWRREAIGKDWTLWRRDAAPATGGGPR